MKLHVARIDRDFEIRELESEIWNSSDAARVEHYWSGEKAPEGRHFSVRLLWSDTCLYVRFLANQEEPFIVTEHPNLHTKTLGLWDRDVCEIFLAPDSGEPAKYFEFEVAPNGEWIDLFVHQVSGRRETDWEFRSGMKVAAAIGRVSFTAALKVPWTAFGRTPIAGETWHGNLFRCIGADPDRGYLAWSPTFTSTPDFHVPEKFGEFLFWE